MRALYDAASIRTWCWSPTLARAVFAVPGLRLCRSQPPSPDGQTIPERAPPKAPHPPDAADADGVKALSG